MSPARQQPPSRHAVAAGYDEAAAGYEERHGDDRSVTRFAVIETPLLAAARGRRRVLEVGCGTGRLLAQVSAPTRVGVDISAAMLAIARRRGLAVVRGDAHQLPFADAAFDVVLAGKGAFRYLDKVRAFAECSRVLRRGGLLGLHHYAARVYVLRDLYRRWSTSHAGQVPATAEHETGPEVGKRCAAARTRSGAGWALADERALDTAAAQAGLRIHQRHLFRPIRWRPYAVRVPTWLPGHWWSHCVLLFRKEK